MRRITKKLLYIVFGLLIIGLYCEFLIYYVVIAQCSWPKLVNSTQGQFLKAFVLADTHLLGPYRGHWLDKLRREWQMHQAFKAVINTHKPDVVFVLGDLFDEGEWTDDRQFNAYVNRFYELFPLPEDIRMHVAVGNHDIGFHHRIRKRALQRFTKLLNAPTVQHIVLKDCHFVLINSMALEGDSCNMCTEARKQISIISEPDAPPLPERNKLFRLKIDALSKEATEFVVGKIKPRAVFGGHTHHGCLIQHTHRRVDFLEYSVPSFSWRNRPDPKYMLVSISPDEYAVSKCALPREVTIIITAASMVFCLIVYVFRLRTLGR